MFDFKYYTPTKVIFGKNTESKVADLIKEFTVSLVVSSGAIATLPDSST